MSYLKDIYASRELMINLALRQVKGQYKKTIFGQLWSLANPLALMLVYTFVFSFVFRINPGVGNPSGLDSFALWLLCGLLPWTFFARALSAGLMSLISNEGLIQKVYFARVVLPISVVTAIGYNWLFEMGILLVALLIAGGAVYLTLPYLLLSMILLFIFTLGLALVMSIVTVYFRDMEHLVAIVLQLWIYLTPIIYPVSLVEQQSEKIGPILGNFTLLNLYNINPMAQFTYLFRDVLYNIRPPEIGNLATCLLWAVIALFCGILIYSRKDKHLAEAL